VQGEGTASGNMAATRRRVAVSREHGRESWYGRMGELSFSASPSVAAASTTATTSRLPRRVPRVMDRQRQWMIGSFLLMRELVPSSVQTFPAYSNDVVCCRSGKIFVLSKAQESTFIC